MYDEEVRQVDNKIGIVQDNAYLHTWQVAALYPLIQAFVSGLLFALFIRVVFWVASWPKGWEVAALAFTLVQLIIWSYSLLRWNDWVYRIEGWTGLDLNNDELVGQPDPPQPVVIHHQDGHTTIARLPREKLQPFAIGLVRGIPLTYEDWTGAGKLLSRREYRTLLDEMIARGIAEWKNPEATAQGARLTKAGMAAMREIAGIRLGELPPSPPSAHVRAK